MTEEDLRIAQGVENAVCSYYDIKIEDVTGLSRLMVFSSARNFIYYILHCCYHISFGKIANRYNRGKRSIKKQVSIMRMCVSRNNSFKYDFNEITAMIK